MSRDNNRQTHTKQRQQQAAVKDAVRAAAAVYTDSAQSQHVWLNSDQSSSHAAHVQVQADNEVPALYLEEFKAQQEQRSMQPPRPSADQLNTQAVNSSYRRQATQPMDSIWARRLKSTNERLEVSYRANASQAPQTVLLSPINRAESTPAQSTGYLETGLMPNRPHSTPAHANQSSLQARHQAAMDFINSASSGNRQRQVGGWTGEASNNGQSHDLDSEMIMSERSHAPVSIPRGSEGDASEFEHDVLLRLSSTQLGDESWRSEYNDDAGSNASSGWQMPYGIPTPNWLGMSPQIPSNDYQYQLGDGYGSMSSFEHEPEPSGTLYSSGKRPSFSFDASTLARTDSAAGTQSSFDANTPPNVFDETSPSASNSTNTMTTPSSYVSNSGPSSAQSLEPVTPLGTRPIRKAAAKGQQKYLSVAEGTTTSSSSDTSERVRRKSSPVKLQAPIIDNQGKFACPHPGCNKKFSTNGHAKRHSHAHLAPNPFICPHDGCDATFSRRDNCTQHQRTRHGGHILKAFRQYAEDEAASPEQSGDDSA